MKKKSGARTRATDAPDEDGLRAYREKRNPASTNEPFTAERPRRSGETRSGRFVVHLHGATRTHYDLRLQFGGTLKSFAVPKGPSLNPDDKRLAVNTEDHPLEYVEFEAVIPEGNYGAGPMIAWDVGRVRYLETTAERGLETGKVDFELAGFKLGGRFALVHTGKRAERGGGKATREWLFFKKSDAYSSSDRDILSERPESVYSGLEIGELERRAEIAAELEQEAARHGAADTPRDVSTLVPMGCSASEVELDDPDRLYELKLDGVRVVADKHRDGVALRYRNGRSATSAYPEIARAVRALAPERVVLDGEIVALDENGKPNFQRLATRIHASRPYEVLRAQAEVSVLYLVFDLLVLGDHDLTNLPLVTRRALLERLIKGRGFVRTLDAVAGRGSVLLDFCRARDLEGIVAKKKNSRYLPARRSDDWVKIKCERETNFVVVGFLTGKTGKRGLGALDVASYEGERLVVRGKVGSGLDERSIADLLARLEPLVVSAPTASGQYTRETGTRRHVRPELVVSVEHMGFTDDGHLWHPVFRGLRPSVDPKTCAAAPAKDLLRETADARVSSAANEGASFVAAISNPDKVFWPDEGYTKRDLCEYYAAVAPVLLPFLRGRPVVLVRYPDGIRGKSFYQWRAPEGTPTWIRTLELRDEEELARGETKSVFLIDNVEALVHVANLGCIPIHVLASSERSLDECGFLTIDLDIGEQPFKSAVVLALSLRELLTEVGLVGYPKTSGQKGLHVLIPLSRGVGFDAAKILVELLGRLLVNQHPDIATMERRIAKRGPRVYVDTGQTGRSRTIVSPYSVRAQSGATVSTPLSWDEVHVGLDPARFTLITVPPRLADVADPMASMLSSAPDVAPAIERLEVKFKSAATRSK